MTDRHETPTDVEDDTEDAQFLRKSALEQFEMDCRLYNEAVGSYNTHLNEHRERRDLHDLPFRRPISAHEAFSAVRAGDPDAARMLLVHLIDQSHLDSHVRRHPGVHPIHLEAIDQLEMARDQLISTLEDVLLYRRA